jgi:XTP/dITP diphosphohydrolase
MIDLLFGTTNPGKLRELRRLLAGLPVRVLSPGDLGRPLPEVDEDGATFQANAEKKAREWARWAVVHALADDSGLCVDALGGAPGVHSARWSDLDGSSGPTSPVCDLAGAAAPELGSIAGGAARDERNNDKLLRLLAGMSEERRGAGYQAVLSLARPDGGTVATVTGTCRGRIGPARRGSGGFGFDPLFVPEEEIARALDQGRPPRTMAELSPEEKDAISHRGAAFRLMLPILARLAGP